MQTIGFALGCAANDSTTADNPDTIDIAQGTYQEHVTIAANVNLIGQGDVTIDGTNSGTVVTVHSGYTVGLTNLTVTGGSDPDEGAGIDNRGTLTVTNSAVKGNTVTCVSLCIGGGIYTASPGVLTLSNSTVSENTVEATCTSNPCSAEGGGVLNNYGTVTLANSMVGNNTASCSAIGCTAYAGGISTTEGTVSLSNSAVKGNTASCSGDACTALGGGILAAGGNLTLATSAVIQNSATCAGAGCARAGGGIAAFGTVTLTDSIVKKNTPDNCFGFTATGCKS